MTTSMPSFKRILVPLDLDDPPDVVLRGATALARDHEGTIQFLHVFNRDRAAAMAQMGGLIEIDDDTIRFTHERISTVLDSAVAFARSQNVQAERISIYGETIATILDHARDEHVDVIVMGTHARDGLARAVMGSVTESVIRHSRVPVLVVHLPHR